MAVNFTYVPIATTTLSTAAASYTFSSIPSTYKDLVLVVNATTSSPDDCYIQFNGDTTSNYSDTWLQGNGTAATSNRDTSATAIKLNSPNGGVLGTNPVTTLVNINNYANTTTFKTVLIRANNTSYGTNATAGLWRATPAAINAIKIFTSTYNFGTGSTFTLYGIAGA